MDLSGNIVFSSGVLGIFIAIPLIWLRKQRPANIYLGVFLIAFSLASFASTSPFIYSPHLFGLLDWSVALLGPSFYLYACAVCGDKVSNRLMWHSIPVFLWVCYTVCHRFIYTDYKLFGVVLLIYQVITMCYAIALLVRLRKHKRKLLDDFSSIQGRDLKWLSYLSIVIIALLFIWVPATISMDFNVWAVMLIIGRLVVLFFIGWFGLRQLQVFFPEAVDSDRFEKEAFDDKSKYQRSSMTDEVKQYIQTKLKLCMSTEKYYLQNDLKLADLAKEVDVSTQHLSEYLNQVLQKTFFQYINEFRVSEAKILLVEKKSLAIIEVAFAAGFNSKSTFNACFKKMTGMTPSKWRNQK